MPRVLTEKGILPIGSIEALLSGGDTFLFLGALMILVTKLNNASFALNADLIERVTADPDTTVTMVDGVRYVVRESVAEIIESVTTYRANVLNRAYHSPRACTGDTAERN